MKLTIDFETRSEAIIQNTGAVAYAQHDSTMALMLSIKVDDEPTKIWICDHFKKILTKPTPFSELTRREAINLLQEADTIEAHNAFFEQCIFRYTLDWGMLPKFTKWRCSAAKAAMHSLPRSLDGACQALGLKQTKDKEGYFTMLKMCKPRKPTKNNKAKWHETSEDIIKLAAYNIQDVEAEHTLSEALSDLPPRELDIWRLDQIINFRGIPVDVQACDNAIRIITEHETELLAQFKEITGLNSPRQVQETLKWLKAKGLKMPNLRKPNVDKALELNIPEDIRKVLLARKSLAKSSTGKFRAMIEGRNKLDCVCDTMLYHGASTGRWAGQRLQPHNMVRDMPEAWMEIIEDVRNGIELDDFRIFYGDPMQLLSGCTRGFIKAPDSRELYCADFSSIEGRVLAWVAEEEEILDNYRAGKCAYCNFASKIHHTPYSEIKHGYENGEKRYADMRFDGKTGELACGYQGGERAIQRYAPDMPLAKRKKIVKIWRENRGATVDFWELQELFAKSAIKYPGRAYGTDYAIWKIEGKWLTCRLPSGRRLYYFDPAIEEVKTEWGLKDAICFSGVDSQTRRFRRQSTYGGKLTENIVQAISRDFLADAMMRVHKEGFKIIFHVHDEIITVEPRNKDLLDEFIGAMTELPKWGEDCPINADGFITKRYHK